MERHQADAFTRWAGRRFDRTRVQRVQLDWPLRVLLTTASLTLLVLAVEAVFGAGTVGISGDDYDQVLRFQQWLEEGWYVPSSFLDGGEPEPGSLLSSPFVYAPAFSLLAHLVNVALGNEGIGEISSTSDAYEMRHLVVALIGLAAVFCVGVAVRVVTRDRLAAIWGSAALLAIPVWTGNSMFNVKDIPVASGFTFVTVGLVLGLAGASQHSWLSPRRPLSVGALVGLGTFIGVGTRPAMWVPFVCSLCAFATLSWLLLRSSGGLLRSVAAPAAGLLVGLGCIAAIYPYAAATPIDFLIGSVSDSSGYQGQPVGTLTAGELLSSTDPPLWYLPAWIFAGVPVIIFALAALGMVVVIRNALHWRLSERGAEAPSRAQVGGMLLVVLQLVLLPAAAIAEASSMYSGLRQHLYVLPAVAILAGIGAAKVLRATRRREGSRRVRWVGALALALALAVPALEQTRLYPYNYVYVNPVAGIGGVQGRWETELQFISSREAFRKIPENADAACSSSLVPAQGPTPDEIIHDCLELPPFGDEVGDEATASATAGETWVVGRTRAGNHPPDYCREHDNVTRTLRTEEIVMAYVLRCAVEGGTVERIDGGSARPAGPEGASMVRDSAYTLALPPRWTRIDPPPGASFTAAAEDGSGKATLWIERNPGLDFAAFEKRSIAQLRDIAGNAEVAERVSGPNPEQTTVRLRAEGPPDSGVGRYDATLRASGRYRYFLLTLLSPDASGIARKGAELIRHSFSPRLE